MTRNSRRPVRRLTESQLRRIIRQEVRRVRLTEIHIPTFGDDTATLRRAQKGITFGQIAQHIVDMHNQGFEPWELGEAAVEKTAIYEPGYEPSFEPGDHSDRMNIIGDHSETILRLVQGLDPDAAAALKQGLSEFDGF